jgi:hypothetical protein
MRGRKPQTFTLIAKHLTVLRELVCDGHTEQRIARRARILLMRNRDERVQSVADTEAVAIN